MATAKLPAFSLKNQDGALVKHTDLRGTSWLLFAFPKAATSGCTVQAKGMQEQVRAFAARGVKVLGLSPDPPEALARWKAQEGFPFDFLSDPEHRLLDALGAWGEKSMYGKTYMGVIRSHWLIDGEGRILDAQVKVSPADSVARAGAAVQDVKRESGKP
jgi:peroxiredoxin Q/BCP